jgi:hypothetical protein
LPQYNYIAVIPEQITKSKLHEADSKQLTAYRHEPGVQDSALIIPGVDGKLGHFYNFKSQDTKRQNLRPIHSRPRPYSSSILCAGVESGK